MAQGIRDITLLPQLNFEHILYLINYHEMNKFQFIQITDDGINCTQKVNLNDNLIWENQLACPPKYEGENNIYMCGEDSRVFNGQIKNFKFFTHKL